MRKQTWFSFIQPGNLRSVWFSLMDGDKWEMVWLNMRSDSVRWSRQWKIAKHGVSTTHSVAEERWQKIGTDSACGDLILTTWRCGPFMVIKIPEQVEDLLGNYHHLPHSSSLAWNPLRPDSFQCRDWGAIRAVPEPSEPTLAMPLSQILSQFFMPKTGIQPAILCDTAQSLSIAWLL